MASLINLRSTGSGSVVCIIIWSLNTASNVKYNILKSRPGVVFLFFLFFLFFLACEIS